MTRAWIWLATELARVRSRRVPAKRAVLSTTVVPGLVLGALIWKFVKEPERRNLPNAHGQAMKVRDFFSVLRYRNIWLCCAGATGFVTWLVLHQIFAPLYITEVEHQAPTTAGILMGASGLGSFCLALFFPTLSDRIGRRPVLMIMAVMSAMVGAAHLSLFDAVHLPLDSRGNRVPNECGAGDRRADFSARAH